MIPVPLAPASLIAAEISDGERQVGRIIFACQLFLGLTWMRQSRITPITPMDYHIRLEKNVDESLKKVAAREQRSVNFLIRQLVNFGVISHPLFVEKKKRK